MEPNSPFQMQYYDQGHGNSNGFPPSFSQSPGMSSPSNNLPSQTPPYAYRSMENGMSRFMAEPFDSQNFQQHPNQFYQQQQNVRRNEANFPFKNQQGFPSQPQQSGNFVGSNRDGFSSPNYNSFLPSNMKGRMPSDSDMFASSSQNFSQARQSFTTSGSRDPYGNQLPMGMMEGGMGPQNPMAPHMGAQTPEFPPQYPQFQNRPDFGRNQFYGPGPGPGPEAGFRSNGMRPEGFNQPFSQSPSPQTPTPGPMEQRPPNMYSPVGPGFPVNQPKGMANAPHTIPNESQRQAAMVAAAAAVRAAAASSRPGRDFPPGTGYPNTYQYGAGPRGFMSPDMMGSPFSNAGNGMQSPSGKDIPSASPVGPNIPRQTANFADSPMSQGRASANSLSFSPNVEQSGFSSPSFSNQSKQQGSSPGASKISPQNETKPSISPQSTSSNSGEVSIKQEPNLMPNCSQEQAEKNDAVNEIDETTLNDAEEIISNASEKVEKPVVKIKKEVDGDEPKVVTNEPLDEEKSQDVPEKNLLAAPGSKSSAPPTPLSGISGASPASSPFPEDLEMASISPSWPNTPTSPTTKRLLQSHSPARFDQLSKLYDLSEDEERRNFLDKYLAFMSVNGTPVTKVPIVCKQPLDLYRLFRAVLERGGLQEVMKRKQFREVLKSIDLSSTSASLAYTVKNQYVKYLQQFEQKNKESFIKAWRQDALSKAMEKSVPTIALNDTLPSSAKDFSQAAQQINKMQQMTSPGVGPDSGLRDWQMPVPDGANQNPFQMNNQIQMAMSQNNAMSSAVGSSFNQSRPSHPGRTSYANTPDMNADYPVNSYMRFQRSGFQRGQNQGYGNAQSFSGSMPQNPMQNPLSPSWPRNFPGPRQVSGPPELYPEGLQRSPWNQQQGSMNRGQHPQAFMSKEQRLANKLKGYPPNMKDQNSPWPTNKGPNIPLKPKRSSTPIPSDHHGQSQKLSIHPALKREPLVFPPDSVENTKPILNKRQKLTSKELGPVEAWRIMMSLKSGMLAECTWAIDTLNILLHDDKTISYFHLPQLPGLLDTLMDHFRRCCVDTFTILDDVEHSIHLEKELENILPDQIYESPKAKRTRKETLKDLWVGVVKGAKSSYTATVASYSVLEGEENYCNLTDETWKCGGGDDTSHIQLSIPNTDLSPRKTFLKKAAQRVTDNKEVIEGNDKEKNGAKDGPNEANNCEEHSLASTSGNSESNSSPSKLQKDTTAGSNCNNTESSKASSNTIENIIATNSKIKEKATPVKSDEANEKRSNGCNGKVIECKKVLNHVKPELLKESKAEPLAIAAKENVVPNAVQNSIQEPVPNAVQNTVQKSNDVATMETTIDTKPVKAGEVRSLKEPEEKLDKLEPSEVPICKDILQTKNDITDKRNEERTEAKVSANLAAFESFSAMECLEEELTVSKPVLEAEVEELCTALELDTDYTKQYLDTSKEFIGYLKNRLTAENRGKVPCQESFSPENSPFRLRTDYQESIVSRLIAVSNIFRSLSFVSGNDNDLANHPGLLLLMGKLLLYRHEHPITDHSEFRLTQEDSEMCAQEASHDSYSELCLEGLKAVRENILVILANVAGQVDLSRYPEQIILPLLDGLLHWVVCQSSEARDPMPTAPIKYALSPKRLALETLAKLSITDNNVDLILATPPTTRLRLLFKELVKAIGIKSSIPVREFAVVVLDNLAHGDNVLPIIVEQKSCIGNVLLFLEEAEKNTSSYVSAGGVVQPGLSAEDVCGTSVNMLRRAADILLCLTKGIIDKAPFLPYVHRLLSLATSQMMDTSVLKILSEIMYELR